jgi:tripartite-type tricarboxylate transporter receptor subunit TctC
MNRQSALALFGGFVGGAVARPAFAQNYPDRSIRYVVPFAPGGGADSAARLIVPKAAELLGQSCVIDNQSGANGAIGSEVVARAPHDGYTVLEAAANQAMGFALYKTQPFSLEADFAPVTLMAKSPLIVVVNPSVPAKSIKELVALAKASPGKLNFASDQGGPMRLGMELLKISTRCDITNVPYNGTAAAILAVLSGDVATAMAPAPALLSYVKSGKLRGIAVSGTERLALVPELPTVAESGVRGFAVEQWYAVLAPASTPSSVVNVLNAAFVKAVHSPDLQEHLRNEILVPVGSSPQFCGRYLSDEVAKWKRVVKDAGIPVS